MVQRLLNASASRRLLSAISAAAAAMACASTEDPRAPDRDTPGADICDAFCWSASFVLERQRDDLAVLATSLSDPRSTNYGQYWSVEQLANTYGASPAVIATVKAYLKDAGAWHIEADVTGSLVTAVLGYNEMNTVFGTAWHGLDSLPVPAELSSVVTGVLSPQLAGPVRAPAVTISAWSGTATVPFIWAPPVEFTFSEPVINLVTNQPTTEFTFGVVNMQPDGPWQVLSSGIPFSYTKARVPLTITQNVPAGATVTTTAAEGATCPTSGSGTIVLTPGPNASFGCVFSTQFGDPATVTLSSVATAQVNGEPVAVPLQLTYTPSVGSVQAAFMPTAIIAGQSAATLVAPATYSIAQSMPAGWVLAITGDCDSSGSLTVTAGSKYACTFTNTLSNPATINAHTIVTGGVTVPNPQEITLAPLGGGFTDQAASVAPGASVPIYTGPGSYQLSVGSSPGAGVGVTISGDCAANGAVTVAAGDIADCTFTYGPAAPPAPPPTMPAWAKGSGAHEPCPDQTPNACADAFVLPLNAEFLSFTPGQLRAAYGVSASGLSGEHRNAVVIEVGGFASPEGLELYRTGFGLGAGSLEQVGILGTLNTGVPDSETVLDVETVFGMAPEVDRVTVITSDSASYAVLFAAALDVSNTGGTLPDAVSLSGGVCEPLMKSLDLEVDVEAFDSVAMTAAAAGVTLVVASGDSGSSGCKEFTSAADPNGLAVSWPASSPWVVSTGGTNLLLGSDNTVVDTQVWNDTSLGHTLAGGGGESILFQQPTYQGGVGSAEGRLVPDVSLMADIFPATVVCSVLPGQTQATCSGKGDGTSQSAPMLAAMVMLLNEQAENAYQPRLGLANPLLYALGGLQSPPYLDVIEGNNRINDDVDCCDAKAGFDEASGWGSPLVNQVAELLAAPAVAVAPSRLPVLQGTRGVFMVMASVPGGTPLRYDWRVDGVLVKSDTSGATISELETTVEALGPHTILVTLTTSLGRSAEGRATLEVLGLPAASAVPVALNGASAAREP